MKKVLIFVFFALITQSSNTYSSQIEGQQKAKVVTNKKNQVEKIDEFEILWNWTINNVAEKNITIIKSFYNFLNLYMASLLFKWAQIEAPKSNKIASKDRERFDAYSNFYLKDAKEIAMLSTNQKVILEFVNQLDKINKQIIDKAFIVHKIAQRIYDLYIKAV